MDNVIEKARKSLESLKSKAAEIEGQIHKLELFLETYAELEGNGEYDPRTVEEAEFQVGYDSVAQPSKKSRVETLAASLLENGKQRKTIELFMEIYKREPELLKSSAELSVYLSGAKDLFVSDRKHGWTLKKAEPQNAGT